MSGPLSAGDLIGGRYVIERYIDEGGMQFVYAAKDQLSGRIVALKTPKNKSAKKRFRRSAIVAAKVNHPNVAKTLDYVSEGDDRYLIEELIEGADLSKALFRRTSFLDPYLVAKVLHHMAKGLAAAHHAGVIHRDLKPTNLMVVGGYSLAELKITDFGIAKMAEEELVEAAEGRDQTLTTSQTAVGALPYMAPEAIDTPKAVTQAADIWSLGAMVFHLLTGEQPFGSGLRAVQKILAAEPPVAPAFVTRKPQFAPLANELLVIANSCMQKDPEKRPTADELVLLCGQLCYTVAERAEGVVRQIKYDAWGFINSETGDTFFHMDSVFGPPPNLAEGDRVIFSAYAGGGSPRAYPVIKITQP
ncbi:serine/threonine-protein kinase [Methyloversatilis discipulorum]|uniref:serine/threonine-protein kinase n=1 Tax=Methyloversatilis discipulorum TaxID=1119528 RepID=UPI001A53D2D8|nr:serine/threonine-protein kinase [Methyloversatilis discipulorum]MBL8467253.1 protein kinase [Methyloversatilis discipulorum]